MADEILIVDDEAKWCKLLKTVLATDDRVITTDTDPEAALELLQDRPFDVILIDLKMPHIDGLEFLNRIRSLNVNVPVIMITGHSTVHSAIEAMKKGAFDYISKPFDVGHLKIVVNRALERVHLVRENLFLKQEVEERYSIENIVGRSPKMQEIYKLIGKVSATSTPVLILGDSGTGKEMVAKAVHIHSDRSSRPFVVVNCSALTETLLESELFGYVKGAFTGAIHSRRGLLEEADGGTLFLDEIGDIPLSVQVDLLRFLQDGEIKRVGDAATRKVDVRLITATNQNLERLMEVERFRQDLYYRLNVVTIRLPTLSERTEDIPLLVQHFIHKYNRSENKRVQGIAEEALERLIEYPWPGNVRELENVIERAIALCQSDIITVQDLPGDVEDKEGEDEPVDDEDLSYGEKKERLIATFEQNQIRTYLRKSGGNVTKAAQLARMPRQSFHRLMTKHGIKS